MRGFSRKDKTDRGEGYVEVESSQRRGVLQEGVLMDVDWEFVVVCALTYTMCVLVSIFVLVAFPESLLIRILLCLVLFTFNTALMFSAKDGGI